MDNNFWLSNPNQLIDKKYIFNLIPKESMNKNEKLNSLVRLSLLISVVFSIFTNDSNYFVIFFLTLLVTVLIWNQTKEKYQEEEQKKQAEEKEFDIENSKFLEGIDDPTTTLSVDSNVETKLENTTFIPDNTEKTEGCSQPLKNNPMINLLPSNYYNQKFACPYTEDFEKKQKDFLKAPISPENNEIYPDNLYFRQFYPVPLPADKRNFFTSLPITEDRKRCKISNENELGIRFACSH